MEIMGGTYRVSVDSARRFCLPADLKCFLGHCCYVTKGVDGCLWLVTASVVQELEQELNNMAHGTLRSLFNPGISRLRRHVFSCMTKVEPDGDRNCRVQLSQEQCDYAHISNKAILIGAGNHVEIWDAAELDVYEQSCRKQNTIIEAAEELFAAADEANEQLS